MDVPYQYFDVYRFSRKAELDWWQRRTLRVRWRGVWQPMGQVVARNPWEACRLARKNWPGLAKKSLRLRAMPTWRKVPQRQLKLVG